MPEPASTARRHRVGRAAPDGRREEAGVTRCAPAPRQRLAAGLRRDTGVGHRTPGYARTLHASARGRPRYAHGRAHRRRHAGRGRRRPRDRRWSRAASTTARSRCSRQSRAFFQISGAGHEALLLGLARSLRAGVRLVLPLLPRPRAGPRAGRHALRDAAASGRRRRRPRVGRPPDAVPLGRARPQHRQPDVMHRQPVPPGGRLRGSGALHQPPPGTSGLRGLRRRAHLRVARRRRDVGRRVLGVAQHRVPAAPPGALRRRRQRLRDLGPARRSGAGADLRDGARHPRPAHREDGRPRLLRGPAQGRRRDRARARRRGPVPRARPGDSSLLPLALRRPAQVPGRRGAGRRGRARPDRRARARAHRTRRAHRRADRGDARRAPNETVRVAADAALAAARPEPGPGARSRRRTRDRSRRCPAIPKPDRRTRRSSRSAKRSGSPCTSRWHTTSASACSAKTSPTPTRT